MTAGKALSNKDMNGLKVTNLGTPTANSDASTKAYTDTAQTNAQSRATHTGTQLASTISDFDAQVRSSRLDQLAVPTAPVSMNAQRLTNVADPTAAQDAATKNYVDNQVSGLVSGQTLKGSVRVAASGNVSIATPGTTIDGATMAVGDLVLLTAQTTSTENGPYVYNGSATPMTRATNWDTNAEAVLGSYWVVREGTKADSFALLSNDTAITLGTTVPTFVFISVAGSAIGRFAVDSPAVAAGGTWTVTHNLGSQDITVMVRRIASPYDFVSVYIAATTTNTVTIAPDIAMAAAEYRAIVKY